METVKQIMGQTSKTILFEEFNSDKMDLATLLINNDPSNEMFQEEIKNKLEVHSFKEFLEKFAPDVYEVCRISTEGKAEIVYTIDKNKIKGQNAVKQPITEHAYYKMLSSLYYEKGSSGESNLQFDDKKILEMLTPKQDVEEARDIRKSLQYNLEKYMELEAKGENSSEYAQQVIDDREKIINKYKDSKIGLLPLAIDDAKTKLHLLEKIAPQEDVDTPSITYVSGMLGFSPEGDLIVEESSAEPQVEVIPDEESEQNHNVGGTITNLLEQDYDAVEENKNDFVKSLVVSVYAPMGDSNALVNLSNEELAIKRDEYEQKVTQYESIYVQARQSFIDEMTAVLEKLLDVKIFFDHATANGGDEGKLEDVLIVTNCKANKLLADNVRTRFEKFIKNRGETQIEHKIWFAILPAIMDKGMASGKVKINPLSAVNLKKNNKNISDDNGDYISFNTAKAMLKVLNESRIMTVFNFKANKNNGFGGINDKYIIDKKEQTRDLDYEHAVLAYPNFTLTRERSIELGNKKITVPGVYIDASYPATALLIASQQIGYLDKHGFKGRVSRNNVCVHVNLEDDEVRKNLITKFNRELALQWDKDIIDEINKDCFGFVFNSDKIYIDNEPLKNTYVYLARTLKKNKDGVYIPIYQILMEDFILKYLNTKCIGLKIKIDTLNNFLNKEVKEWRREGDKYINCILKGDEEIKKDEDSEENSSSVINLKIKFVNDEATVKVDVNVGN